MLIQNFPHSQRFPSRRGATNPIEKPCDREAGDRVTLSSHDSHRGWKIAGVTLMLASVPLAIASKNLAVGLVGGAVGVGLMFGPDN